MKDKIHIFLADDDEDDRDFFQEAITNLPINYSLDMVDNGEKAVNYFKNSKIVPDFVFLDINMPIKNGFECLMDIKKIYPTNNFHSIVLSTSISFEDVDSGYNLGASAYIQKPGSIKELTQYLDYCINKLSFLPKREDFILNSNRNRIIAF